VSAPDVSAHDYGQQYVDFWRVWWHCLSRLWRDGGLGAHRMCELRVSRVAIGVGPKWHWCTCGYNEEKVPNEF